MRSFILLLSGLLAGCQSPQPIVFKLDMGLSASDIRRFERKAAGGDAEAARKLSTYYAFDRQDEKAADPWLRRAAELKHPQSQRDLAYLIKEYDSSPAGFGVNAREAVRSLLEQSAQTEGNACYDLASAYAEGYFGSVDHSKARIYFCQGANLHNRMCWKELSRYYRHGLGGPRDDAEAYYWIALEARCLDPRSVNGEETWRAREEIASHLSLAELEREWKRVDAFISLVTAKKVVVDDYPFLSGAISKQLEAEGRCLSQQREDEHRRKCRSSGY